MQNAVRVSVPNQLKGPHGNAPWFGVESVRKRAPGGPKRQEDLGLNHGGPGGNKTFEQRT